MDEQFSRTELLIGENNVEKLKGSRVAIFGVGGVGGYVCEALVRSGIGEFDLIDSDTVAASNLNRQIIALHSTVDKYKVDVMKDRMLDINPDVKVNVHKCFYLPENAGDFDFSSYDYVVDAVDTVTAKIDIILRAKEVGVPVISAMGAGNKLDPSAFKVADIYKTKVCPLCKVMRKELKKRNVKNLKVVYSEEEPLKPEVRETDMEDLKASGSSRRSTPGSTAFTPAACGLVIASEVVKDIISK
ncbi:MULTISPECIES: tRNA threonylcarbamoyladenosine dehydratase [unclassified Butyrivibrio]|uniref:tRNA threonylcarbamoyladenosine dehydratase n=1 Tax=unclassified Butyrivibrio TaxID=2639466 RepID=UPI0003B54902|nr:MULTISPECIES: tRNA threonylcarbamoyladenosine dehydratase [unclassified Butyrivibrio]SEK37401.1 tRNA A37 threonylcarbamoyladenosine dehydratase [Butyrivibrio sp. ob235]